MSRRSRAPRLEGGMDREPWYLRWKIIVPALLFVWPAGLLLLITKIIGSVRQFRKTHPKEYKNIPYQKHKSRAEQEAYIAGKKRRGKMVFTSILMTALFLVLGCLGLTKTYVNAFWDQLRFADLIRDMLSYAAFVLLGVYLASRANALCLQERRLGHILEGLKGRQSLAFADLVRQTGIPEEQLREDVQTMVDAGFFGSGAGLDEETGLLYCWR